MEWLLWRWPEEYVLSMCLSYGALGLEKRFSKSGKAIDIQGHVTVNQVLTSLCHKKPRRRQVTRLDNSLVTLVFPHPNA